MKNTSFLSRLLDETPFPSGSCFVSSSSPALFLMHMLNSHVEKAYGVQLKVLSTPTKKQEWLDLLPDLEQSFLGQAQWYAIALHAVPSSLQTAVVNFVQSYIGPHTLFIIYNRDEYTQITPAYTLLESVSNEELQILTTLFSLESAAKKLQAKILPADMSTVPADEVVVLLHYLECISVKHIQKSRHYLATLVSQSPALYQLTDLYFAGKKDSFLAVWSQIYGEHPETYWIFFWCDILWRAYYAAHFISSGNMSLARKIGYRLPRSFFSKGYKRVSKGSLAKAYTLLATFDTRMKQGSRFSMLDMLVMENALNLS